MSCHSLHETVVAIGGTPYDFAVLPFVSTTESSGKETLTSHEALFEAVKLAGELLVRDSFMSGSLASHVGNPEAKVGKKSELLNNLQDVLTNEIDPRHALIDESRVFRGIPLTFKTALAMGAYRLDWFKPLSYFTKSMLTGMLGANIDFQGTDALGDTVASNEKMAQLLHLIAQDLGGNKNDTRATAIFSMMTYFNRFTTHKFTQVGDTWTGDMNFMLMSSEHKERYVTMLNYRRDYQTGKLMYAQDGELVVEMPEWKMIDMGMVGEPENLGEWLMHTARAVRMMVIDGRFKAGQIDIASFMDKIPKNKKIGYEAVVAMVQNLIVAEEHNPGMTKVLFEKLGLDQYCVYGEQKKESKIIQWFGNNRREIGDELRRGMEEAERELIDNSRFAEGGAEMRLARFAPKIMKYLPVSLSALYKLIPKPEDRERIVAKYVGPDIDTYQVDEVPWIKIVDHGREVMVKRRYYEAMMMFEGVVEEARKIGWPEEKIKILSRGRDELYRLAYAYEDKIKGKIAEMMYRADVMWWEGRNNRTWDSELVN